MVLEVANILQKQLFLNLTCSPLQPAIGSLHLPEAIGSFGSADGIVHVTLYLLHNHLYRFVYYSVHAHVHFELQLGIRACWSQWGSKTKIPQQLFFSKMGASYEGEQKSASQANVRGGIHNVSKYCSRITRSGRSSNQEMAQGHYAV